MGSRPLQEFGPFFFWVGGGVGEEEGADAGRGEEAADEADGPSATGRRPRRRHSSACSAETCNVSEACRQSGVPMTVAYRRRKMDAAFRAGVDRRRSASLIAARAGAARTGLQRHREVIRRQDGSEERMREYSNQLGFQLLKMHRDTAIEADPRCRPTMSTKSASGSSTS